MGGDEARYIVVVLGENLCVVDCCCVRHGEDEGGACWWWWRMKDDGFDSFDEGGWHDCVIGGWLCLCKEVGRSLVT